MTTIHRKDSYSLSAIGLALTLLAGCSGGGGNTSSEQNPSTPPPSKDGLATCMKKKTKSVAYQDVIKAYKACGGKQSADDFGRFMEARSKVSIVNGKLAIEIQ